MVDIGEETLLVGSPAAFSEDGTQPLDPSCVNMTAAISALEPVTVDDIGVRRVEAQRVARLACALEMLGVCEHLMQLAVSYALDRTAVRSSDRKLSGPSATAGSGRGRSRGPSKRLRGGDGGAGPGPRSGPSPRRHAGEGPGRPRLTRRVTQATLQVLGAVGFTWEHDHHRYQRRALTLDALFGTYHELVAVLGAVPTDAPLRRVGRDVMQRGPASGLLARRFPPPPEVAGLCCPRTAEVILRRALSPAPPVARASGASRPPNGGAVLRA